MEEPQKIGVEAKPTLPNVAEVNVAVANSHDLATTITQVEIQKNKRRRRATPPTASSSVAIVGDHDANAMSASSSKDMSGLPENVTLLPNVDTFSGSEVLVSKPIKAARVYRSAYDGEEGEGPEGSVSKAATRMRKYRADHRHDQLWLAKEAERMRNMRAARKAGVNGIKDEKPKREKVCRRKKEKSALLSELAPVEKFNHEEYLRKEAERVRKYRALKQLDPEWKKNDSDRMRLYRAKRKLDSGVKAVVPAEVPMDLLMPPTIPVSADVPTSSTTTAPNHSLIQPPPQAVQATIKAEDTDSEDEAQV